jgi:hypothetical protein
LIIIEMSRDTVRIRTISGEGDARERRRRDLGGQCRWRAVFGGVSCELSPTTGSDESTLDQEQLQPVLAAELEPGRRDRYCQAPALLHCTASTWLSLADCRRAAGGEDRAKFPEVIKA